MLSSNYSETFVGGQQRALSEAPGFKLLFITMCDFFLRQHPEVLGVRALQAKIELASFLFINVQPHLGFFHGLILTPCPCRP